MNGIYDFSWKDILHYILQCIEQYIGLLRENIFFHSHFVNTIYIYINNNCSSERVDENSAFDSNEKVVGPGESFGFQV